MTKKKKVAVILGVMKSPANHFNEPSHKTIWGKGGSASYDENSPDESKRQRLKYGSIQRDGILWKCFNEKKWIVYDRNGEILK